MTLRKKLLVPVLVLAALGLVMVVLREKSAAPQKGTASRSPSPVYAGSLSCKECHTDIFEKWQDSHHALAEVPFDDQIHGSAFEPGREVKHGGQKTVIGRTDGACTITTMGADGKVATFTPLRVIGKSPLWQVVVAAEGGREQVTSLAYDPVKHEWFDVYGDENRRPDEWGFWANRGMTWNAMCGSCHNTGYEKNYAPETDSYDTRFFELGVGCEGCHGPQQNHVRAMTAEEKTASEKDPSEESNWLTAAFRKDRSVGEPILSEPERAHATRMMDTCGSCHARRVDLTGTFRPGDLFLDHFRPVIPDETDLFYEDGQVREEDYEYTSFLSSRMYALGVRCSHCHDPHTARLRTQGNPLCLNCHQGKIDPVTHSHHDVTQSGGQCVGCHMPETTYMQRHPRRDHGFTIPDPALTRDYGIPNACNRCHEDQSVEWALEWTSTWYGERMDRHTQERARVLAEARRQREGASGKLAAFLKKETSTFWRAVGLGLSEPWLQATPDLQEVLSEALASDDPLLRSTAARLTGGLLEDPNLTPRTREAIKELLAKLIEDPVRAVRIDTAWALRRSLSLTNDAGRELERYLAYNSDQPAGALQRGIFHFDRQEKPGNLGKAIGWLEKAVTWDPNAAPLHQSLAIAYSSAGRPRQAIVSLERAHALEPKQATYTYDLALGLSELGKLEEAERYLQRTVELDETFARAWYNLALARNQLGKPQEAIDTLRKLQALEPQNPDYVYTRATILRDMGRFEDALKTVKEAEQLAPGTPLLLQFRASLHKALGQEEEARAAWAQYRQAEALQRLQRRGQIPEPDRR